MTEELVVGPLRRLVKRHYGPGEHPGTGTEQEVHSGDDLAAEYQAVLMPGWRLHLPLPSEQERRRRGQAKCREMFSATVENVETARTTFDQQWKAVSVARPGAWVYSIAPFTTDVTFFSYDTPSAVPDWFIDFTNGRIMVGGDIKPFSAAARRREDARAYSKDRSFEERHMGPGPHPSGSEQQVHAGGGESGTRNKANAPEERFTTSGGVDYRRVAPDEYQAAFRAAMQNNDRAAFVTDYSSEQLEKMQALYVTADGKCGLAVLNHGDGRIEATGAFNNGAQKGALLDMLRDSTERDGVNYAEAFGPFLPKYYAGAGFGVENEYPFDEEQAPAGWNYEKHGRPNYYTMRLQ